jgi:hypothetical protein
VLGSAGYMHVSDPLPRLAVLTFITLFRCRQIILHALTGYTAAYPLRTNL